MGIFDNITSLGKGIKDAFTPTYKTPYGPDIRAEKREAGERKDEEDRNRVRDKPKRDKPTRGEEED